MRGKKAKAIRREIFGDTSHKDSRTYVQDRRTGQIRNDPRSYRGQYTASKKLVVGT
jgi:hypothetical protein